VFGRGARHRATLARRSGEDSELIAGLAQREQSGADLAPSRDRHAPGPVELGQQVGEVLVPQAVEGHSGVQAQRGRGQQADLPDPVLAPPQLPPGAN